MRDSEIKIWTRATVNVSGQQVLVEVVGAILRGKHMGYRVRRVDSGRTLLPKLRYSNGLHAAPRSAS